MTRTTIVALLAWVAMCVPLFAQSNGLINFEEAKQRADAGDAFAQAVVALHYQLGWNTGKNPELAAKYATASANRGDSFGLFRLGTLLRAGEGVARDERKGVALQASSFEGLRRMPDNPYALTALGTMFFQGRVFAQQIPEERRYAEAARLYKLAAEMDYAPAEFNYAMALSEGRGVPQYIDLAHFYLARALEASYPPAVDLMEAQALSPGTLASGMNRICPVRTSASRIFGLLGDKEWDYGFLDQDRDSSKKPLLVPTSTLSDVLFADDEWIVLKRFIPDGSGYSSSRVFFFDARSSALKHSLTMPNNALHLDRSKTRDQFLIATSSAGYLPLDGDHALILVDLNKRVLERIRIWRDAEYEPAWGFAGRKGKVCAPRWRDDGIEIPLLWKEEKLSRKGRMPRPNPHAKLKVPEFGDITLRYVEKAEPSRFVLSSERRYDSLENLAGIPTSAAKEVGHRSGLHESNAVVGAVNFNGEMSNILVRFDCGFLDHLNLSTLRAESRHTPMSSLDGMGLLRSGVIWLLSDDTLSLIGRGKEFKIDLRGSMGASEAGNADTGVATTPRIYFSRWVRSHEGKRSEKMQLDAGACAVYVARFDGSEVAIKKIADDGVVSDEVVRMPKEMRGESENFSLDARRSSLAFVRGDFRDGYFWSETDWSTGLLKTSPTLLSAATPDLYGPWDCFHGDAPPGWILLSSLSGKTKWGALASAIQVTEVQSGRTYEVSTGSHRHKEPLIMEVNRARDAAFVVSSGETAARIEKVNLATGHVTRLREWEWEPGSGSALYESAIKRLWIPSESGYTLYQIGGDGPLGELSFEGELVIGGPGQYAFVLPDGRYAGSPGCEQLLRLSAESGERLSASVLVPWRNRPAEVLRALQGDRGQVTALAKVTERWLERIGFDPEKPEPQPSDLPQVNVADRPPLRVENSEVSFSIDWIQGLSPLSKVIVRVNGVETLRFEAAVLEDASVADGCGQVAAAVKLANGQNWIEVVAEDLEGRFSEVERFRTIMEATRTASRRFVVALGVSAYKNPELNLQFAAKDANDMARMFGAGGSSGDLVLILTDEQVNRSSLEKIREFVGDSSESDEVVLFCAGHGVLDSKLDYYFAGYDFDQDRPAETGLKLDDLVRAVSSAKALKRLILLDTCHAGVVGEKDEMLLAQVDTKLPAGVRAIGQRGMKVQQAADFSASDKKRFIEEMFTLPGTVRGVNIIGASAGAQFALESDKWNNGVFTASVIEGLRDKKADWNQDGRIMISELKNYLGQRVSELTAGAQQPSIVAFEQDQDFDLVN